MKSLVLSILTLTLVGSAGFSAAPQKKIDLKKDFNSLGDNEAVVERAKALDPKNKYKVVQSRAVDRHMRLEIGANYGLVGGGDSYFSTQNLGANLDFHITPYISVGARYYHSFNTLTPEGKNVFENAKNGSNSSNGNYYTPGIDYPIDTTLAVVSWYPIYGKLNLFDMGVSHFDVYTLGGAGSTTLSSGPAMTYTLGGGLGFWFTNYFCSRLEARWQTYNDHPYVDAPSSSTRQVNEVVGMFSLGFLL